MKKGSDNNLVTSGLKNGTPSSNQVVLFFVSGKN